MKNRIIRTVQALLIGIVFSSVGYSYNTKVFWMCMVIMVLQWIKELE